MDSSIVVNPKPTKNNLMVLGVGCLVILAILYFVYRFVKNTNHRISCISETLGKLIDKTNHLQHMISQPSVPHMRPSQVPAPVPPAACPVEKTPAVSVPPSTQIPVPSSRVQNATPPRSPTSAAPVINLDDELQDELNELQQPTLKKEKEEDVIEGRIDE